MSIKTLAAIALIGSMLEAPETWRGKSDMEYGRKRRHSHHSTKANETSEETRKRRKLERQNKTKGRK